MTIDKNLLAAETLFDQISESYEDAYCDNAGLKVALDRLRDSYDAGSLVLDVGCDLGGPASSLSEAGFNVTGIDISQNMINHCQKNIPGTFHKADMTKFEPNQQFDAVISLFSMFQISYLSTYSMLFKMTSWLCPGGTLILATIPAEEFVKYQALYKGTDYVEQFGEAFMGRVVPSTFLTMKGWLRVIQEAGLVIEFVERHSFEPKGLGYTEEHMFITARRTNLEPNFGPYPLPASRRASHLLSGKTWKPFAERLTSHEFDVALKVVASNKEVIDVGSGYGVAIAKELGKVYAIEPNCDREPLLVNSSHQLDVEIRQGTAKNIPYEDNRFDAVVALWVLQYVDELEQSLAEMARVTNPNAPNARIVIVQAAPDIEVINLIKAYALIAGESTSRSVVDHHGFLLATTSRVFAKYGFGNVSVARVDAVCNFPEEDLSARCEQAATVLTQLWYKDHPRCSNMKEAFQPVLRDHFADRPFEIGNQSIILIAQPTTLGEI
ncbi:methyltransferase-like protein [Trichoderma evansii]